MQTERTQLYPTTSRSKSIGYLFLLVFCLAWNQPLLAVTFTVATAIGETDTSYDNQDIIVDGATLTLSGHHAFSSLTLQNGAIVTHPTGQPGGVSITAGNVVIDASSKIDASYRGQGTLPGLSSYSGASYGGQGGVASSSYSTNPTYGDPRAPVDLGAGNQSGQRGGGVLKLVADQLRLDGQILANGSSTTGGSQGGASGGSVWLDLGILSGVGSISAAGGNGKQGGYAASGGGGGRVAIYYGGLSGFDFMAQVQATGGAGYGSSRPEGAAGTIYLKDKTALVGELRLDNGSRAATTASTDLGGSWPDLISINNNRVQLADGSGISALHGTNNAHLVASGSLTALADAELILDGASATIRNTSGHFKSLILRNNTILTHPAGYTGGISIDVGNVVIDASSKIDVSARGQGALAGLSTYSGASYGGHGGVPSGSYSTNPTYGDPRAPVDLGAGNQGSQRGGGALKLVADQLQMDGQILANGSSTTGNSRGGASGGSVWLDLGVLSGTGSISAAGGNGKQGGYPGSGGGGGRVAIYYGGLSGFDLGVQVQAIGGADYGSNRPVGAAGTIYLKDKTALVGELRLDNGSRAATTAITDLSGDWPELISINNNRVQLADGSGISALHGTNNAHLVASGSLTALVDAELILDGVSATIRNTSGHFKRLILRNNTTLTHPVGYTGGISIDAGSVVIDASSKIDVSYRGQGPLLGLGNYSGASYGGQGGVASSSYSTNPTYGDPRAPVELGAGNLNSQRGGGALKLVADQLQLDGQILANGSSTTGNTQGGASGGSVWLDLGILSGVGSISAAGGNGKQGSYAGSGGGGGRVAIYYGGLSGFDFMAQVQATGGAGYGSSRPEGAAGTIYLKDKTALVGELRLDNGSRAATTASTDLGGNWPDLISINNNQVLLADGSGVGKVHGSNNATMVATGGLIALVDTGLILDGISATIRNTSGHFKRLILRNNTTLTHPVGYTGGISIDAGSVVIDASSKIDVSYRGQGPLPSLGNYSGASYGGRGGVISSSYSTNPTYGDPRAPVDLGAGNQGGGRGGGAFKLVADQLQLDGQILANGSSTTGNTRGGASGGSVWLDLGILSGVGSISAAGGNGKQGSYAGSGGGGGRVAIYYGGLSGFDFMAQVQATGGAGYGSSRPEGAAGTIYLKDKTALVGELRLDNGARAATTASTDLGGNWPDLISINNNQVLLADGSGIGKVHGSNNATMVATGGLIALVDTGLILDGVSATIRNTSGHFKRLILRNNTTLTHPVGYTGGISIDAGSVVIDASSKVDVSYRGQGPLPGLSSSSGASYGGRGGVLSSSYSTNPTYGDPRAPVDLGAGNQSSERGGGAFKLVADQLQLDGQILANGSSTTGNSRGGASGGSVWLDLGIISGTGNISAAGGNGNQGSYAASGGGGGRVAIYYGGLSGFDLVSQVTALGGAGYGDWPPGEPGTIHVENNQSPARIIAASPEGDLNVPVSELSLRFNVDMDASSVTPADIQVTGPAGAIIPSAVVAQGAFDFQVSFDPALDAEGQYQIGVGPDVRTAAGQGMDQDRDGLIGEIPDDVYSFGFRIDQTGPATPLVSTLLLPPEVNLLSTRTLTLSGQRDPETSIWVDGTLAVSLGTGDWEAVLSLTEGVSRLQITARDAAGNDSAPLLIDFDVDSTPPKVLSISPAHNALLTIAPEALVIHYQESGRGLDLNALNLSVSRNGQPESGDWSHDVTNQQLRFAPLVGFRDGDWLINGSLSDLGGLSSSLYHVFGLDTVPPAAPTVDPIASYSIQANITLAGGKEAGSALWLNGAEVLAHTDQTRWSHAVTLNEGVNNFSLELVDQAGNHSPATQLQITYDNTVPDPVPLLIHVEGDGTSLQLDWSAYDEAAAGNDIADYILYRHSAPYTDITAATEALRVPGGQQSTTLSGLTRGQTLYLALVAVDTAGNSRTQVTPLSATPLDTQAPADVTGLQVTAYADQLTVQWSLPTAPASDLVGYRLRVDAGTAIDLTSDQTQYQLTGLSPASGYALRLSAYDGDGNESAGATLTGITLLPNPEGLTATAQDGRIELQWQAVVPAQYLGHYALYAQTAPYTQVTGLTPVATVPANQVQAQLSGLDNGVQYHLAVTAINGSGGETPGVIPVIATPAADEQGPLLSNPSFASAPLSDGQTLSQSGLLSIAATDTAGVSRVLFQLDGQLLASDSNGSDGYQTQWDIRQTTDGPHVLRMVAYDSLENSSELSLNLTLALAAPAAPSLTDPAAGLITNQSRLELSGLAEPAAQVRIQRAGQTIAGPVNADAQGHYRLLVDLNEGANSLVAIAANRGGDSPASPALTLTLDSSVPDAPKGLTASAQSSGQIDLSWDPVTDDRVVGYRLYRASQAFETQVQAAVVNATVLSGRRYEDLPPTDAIYTYRLVAVNALGTESGLSSPASAVSDRARPYVQSLSYQPSGAYDPITGRMGPGRVAVSLQINEPLLSLPFLSLAVEGGLPINVSLAPVDAADASSEGVSYEGHFDIVAGAPSGTAYAIFSARDLVGNRGDEIQQGATLEIDAEGPTVTRLSLVPGSPVLTTVDSPSELAVAIELDQAAADVPQLHYRLSGTGRSDTAIVLSAVSDQVWQGTMILPADAGQLAPETLAFAFSASDDLGNLGDRIAQPPVVEVYQGALPALAIPRNLGATAQPGGVLALTWEAVTDAAAYQLYRQAPGETQLSLYQRTTDPQYQDPVLDGDYSYAVASIRQANGQEGLSQASDPVSVLADGSAPGAPQQLELTLLGSGVRALWLPPAGTETGLSYTLYRTAGTELTDVTGLTPLQTDIVANSQGQLGHLDTRPDKQQPLYAVTAVDAAGNASAPSTPAYLNVLLLPVNNLQVTQQGQDAPLLTWSHSDPGIAGYNLYLGENPASRLNSQPLTSPAYLDSGYQGDLRIYTVTALDAQGVESLGRSVRLQPLQLQGPTQGLRRGIMNQLDYQVSNPGAQPLENIRLQVEIQGVAQSSNPFNLGPGETRSIPLILGGQADLPASVTANTQLQQTGAGGEQMQINGQHALAVGDGALLLSVETRELTRGASGQARFSLENSSAVETEILLADANNQPSSQIRFQLQDADGNLLSSQSLHQSLGVAVVTLADGRRVARLAPGARFTTDWTELSVPSGASVSAAVLLSIDQLHYHLGQSDQVSLSGPSGRTQVSLADTAYQATLDSVSPQQAFGGQPVTISGQALNTADQSPAANVPVTVIIASKGFERSQSVQTDAQGRYQHLFTPQTGESGVYTVSVIHPEQLERPAQGQFIIQQVQISPTELHLDLPRNYAQTLAVIKATAGEGTEVHNLRLVLDTGNQPGAVLPDGLVLSVADPQTLTSNQSTTLGLTLTGDNSAEVVGELHLKVLSDETGTDPIANLVLHYQLSEAQPSLHFSPNFVETGVAHEGSVTETVTLENRGLGDLTNLQLSLRAEDGSAAPAWLYLISPTDQGNLAVGEQRAIQFVAAPPASVSEGIHAFKLHLDSGNHPSLDINLFVAVTQSGQGNILFKVADIYTATLDAQGVPIPGLANASIRVQNEQVLSIEQSLRSDAFGEALFQNLPAGRYRFRASALDHEDTLGRFEIKPGVTATQALFLDYNLISVEWSVTEITLEDRYEISLELLFETDVPAAVLVMEPVGVTLPAMQPGDVYYGEVTLSNYGLVSADGIHAQLPADNPSYHFDLLQPPPQSLGAKGSVTLAYRMVALEPLDSCQGYSTSLNVNYGYQCANGTRTSGSCSHVMSVTPDASCSISSDGGVITDGSGGVWYGGTSGSGGTSVSGSSSYSSLDGAECIPTPEGCDCCNANVSGAGAR